MQDTSLMSWVELQPALGERQAAVHTELGRLKRATNKDLAEALGWPINCVTPRVLELRKMGLVMDDGEATQANNRRAKVWKIIPKRW
jgi:hypothetical protein